MLYGCLAIALGSCARPIATNRVRAIYRPDASYPADAFSQPMEGAVVPPDMAPITFSWERSAAAPQSWVVLVELEGGTNPKCFATDHAEWTPEPGAWELIKKASVGKTARLTVLGVRAKPQLEIVCRARVSFTTSPDPVSAPIFYREVNLPFLEAVKDPTRIRWRFGTIDSRQPPPVVLEHLPVCGNCHSFSRSGQVLGMDVDYANNKGSYVITRVDRQMKLAPDDIITWDDYRREDGQQTFGLLSQVSPDGQEVISTVIDKSVFVPKPELAFSQLFFPIKGILAVYHRATGTFTALPVADDPQYVQSNPTWSPDGQFIVFARAKAFQLKNREADMNCMLAEAYSKKGMSQQAIEPLRKALTLSPRHARAHYLLALVLAAQGSLDEALQHLHTASSIQPRVDTSPELHFLLSVNYEKAGQFKEALQSAERALALAPAQTDPAMLNAFKERIETCRQKLP
jgi:hypothetical protein